MMDFIMAPTIIGIVTLGIYKLFELFACRRERMAIIEKLGDKITTADLTGSFTLPDYGRNRITFSALKGGCLMLGIGLGLLIGFMICWSFIPDYLQSERNWNSREIAGIVYGANVLLFGGLGLITAFLIELKLNKKKDNR